MAQVGPDQGLPIMEVFSSHGIGGINCISLHPTDPQIYWIGVAQGGYGKPPMEEIPICR